MVISPTIIEIFVYLFVFFVISFVVFDPRSFDFVRAKFLILLFYFGFNVTELISSIFLFLFPFGLAFIPIFCTK